MEDPPPKRKQKHADEGAAAINPSILVALLAQAVVWLLVRLIDVFSMHFC